LVANSNGITALDIVISPELKKRRGREELVNKFKILERIRVTIR
jgi:hypothetical protein